MEGGLMYVYLNIVSSCISIRKIYAKFKKQLQWIKVKKIS